MHRFQIMTGMAIVFGLTLSVPVVAQQSEQFRDFRGANYSVEDLERAMIPSAPEPGFMRGLPKPGQALPKPPTKVSIAPNVLFPVDSDEILPQYAEDLHKLGQVLQRNPDYHFRIEGHTDSSGPESYNLELSERRAISVKRYLVQSFDIGYDRLTVVGRGKNQPRQSNDTSSGRKANRRVEFVTLEK